MRIEYGTHLIPKGIFKVKKEEEEIEGENGETVQVPQKLKDQEIEEIEEKTIQKFKFYKNPENWLHLHQSSFYYLFKTFIYIK